MGVCAAVRAAGGVVLPLVGQFFAAGAGGLHRQILAHGAFAVKNRGGGGLGGDGGAGFRRLFTLYKAVVIIPVSTVAILNVIRFAFMHKLDLEILAVIVSLFDAFIAKGSGVLYEAPP